MVNRSPDLREFTFNNNIDFLVNGNYPQLDSN